MSISSLLKEAKYNLLAGLRLSLFLPVRLIDFRISLAQLLIYFALSIGFDLIGTLHSVGSIGRFNENAIFYEAFTFSLLLLTTTILAKCYRRPSLLLAVPVVVLASSPLLLFLGLLKGHLENGAWNVVGNYLILAYGIALLMRVWWVSSLAIRYHFSVGKRVPGALALIAALVAPAWIFQQPPLWIPIPNNRDGSWLATPGPSAVSEQVLHAQPEIFATALAELQAGRPGATDIYFVGFAPYATDSIFQRDVVLAEKTVREQFSTAGRSITLINSPETVLEQPLATVSNLEDTLGQVSQIMNPEQDILFLYLSSRGSKTHELTVEFSPLELNQLTPTALMRILNQTRIKYKIIVVSACYSGGFIEPFRDPTNIIITATDSDHSSFDCGGAEEMTYFGDAFFRSGLMHHKLLMDAFAEAKAIIAAREGHEHFKPSNPQIYSGEVVAEKLRILGR